MMFPQVKAGRPHAAHTLLPSPLSFIYFLSSLALASPKEVLKKPVGLSFPREIQDTILVVPTTRNLQEEKEEMMCGNRSQGDRGM